MNDMVYESAFLLWFDRTSKCPFLTDGIRLNGVIRLKIYFEQNWTDGQ